MVEELRSRARFLFAISMIIPNLIGYALRNKPVFLYYLPVQFAIYYGANLYLSVFQGAQEFDTEVALMNGLMRNAHMLLFYTILLTPSPTFLICGNFTTYILSNLFMIVKLADTQNGRELARLLFVEPVRVVTMYVFFHILQFRELKRFFEQEKSEQKSDQMTSILDA